MTTRAIKLRLHRALGVANERIRQSKYVIWCFEPEKMPAMIDLLIAQGRLSESDRPHCVHWTAVTDSRPQSQEDIARTVDADEMLDRAGIRTLTAQAWDALLQGMEAFEAFMRDRYGGGLDPDEFSAYDEVRRRALRFGPVAPELP